MRNIHEESLATRQRGSERGIETLLRRGPGRWIEVGGDDPDAPPYVNSFATPSVDLTPLAFRHGTHGELQFQGTTDASAAVSETVAFTLPESWWPDDIYTVIGDVREDGQWVLARYKVTPAGVVTIEFPISGGGPGPWVEPTLINSWVNAGFPYCNIAYRLNDESLEFMGHIKGGASGTIAFYLQAAYWPDCDLSTVTDVITPTTPGVAQIHVTASNGAVTVTQII